jgi:hypothetical protein
VKEEERRAEARIVEDSGGREWILEKDGKRVIW